MELDESSKLNLCVFGFDILKGHIFEPIDTRTFTLNFLNYNTQERLNDYDGVILFQCTFERFNKLPGGGSTIRCQKNQLDKRMKELDLLVKDGKFLAHIITAQLKKQDDIGQNTYDTDAVKIRLSRNDIHWDVSSKRETRVNSLTDEFRPFIEKYGAAMNRFNLTSSAVTKPLARIDNWLVSMLTNQNEYFIPSLIPEDHHVEEYFNLICAALVANQKKESTSTPEWVRNFSFSQEATLNLELDNLSSQIRERQARLSTLDQFKGALAYTGQNLASVVSKVFETGLSINTSNVDNYIEDISLFDELDIPLAVCEVKGVNKGVTREHINQTDSHRERSGHPDSFPAILIANTHIKNAKTVPDKDQEIAKEQIAHSVRMNVLILRTYDLLGLTELHLSNALSKTEVINLLTKSKGWLRFQDQRMQLIQE